NRKLGFQNFRITGGGNPLGQLRDRCSNALKRATDQLRDNQIQSVIDDSAASIKDWDRGGWRSTVPGKRLLRLFAGGIGAGLPYERLQSLIIAEMREDDRLWPDEFQKLREAILRNFPTPDAEKNKEAQDT